MLHSTLRLLRCAVLALVLVALLAGAVPLHSSLLDPETLDWPTPARLVPAQPESVALDYRPAVRRHDGSLELYRPDGSCSIPVPVAAPFGLEAACQVHDLAYDRLRLAHQRGSESQLALMAARLHADLAFVRRSHEQCAGLAPLRRPACHAVANVFGAAVLLNSARQGFGSASPESPVQLGLWGLGLLITLGGVGALRRRSGAVGTRGVIGTRGVVGTHERHFLGLALPRAGVHRIYVGVRHGWCRRVRLAHLTAELDRTGAFGGGTVCLVVTTGSGWVNPHALSTLAQVSSGPLTVVALQYSRLPSWAVTLLRPGLAARTATAAIGAVADHRDAVAAGSDLARQTRLVVHGESLGAGGIVAAAGRAPSLAGRIDAGLLVSPPGSVEQGPPGRMVLVRHVDDPVVWCTPVLLWRPVHWRAAPADPAETAHRANPAVATSPANPAHVRPPWRRWRPVWTFLRVLRSLPAAGDQPFGHGHRYGPELSADWAEAIRRSERSAAEADLTEAEEGCGTIGL